MRSRLMLVLCTAFVLDYGGISFSAQPFQLWGGKAPEEWANHSKAVVLTDMSQCAPAWALSPKMKKGCWKVIPYEMTTIPIRNVDGPPYKPGDGYAGKMVWAGAQTGAPPLAIPLGVKGWHAIFIGVFGGDVPTVAEVKLDTDAAPLRLSNSNRDYYGNSREMFFKVAELSEGGRLIFSPQLTGFTSACGITYIKLIPLTAAEVERILADRADRSHRTMNRSDDGFSSIYYYRPTTVEQLLAFVEPLRDTDCGTFLLEAFGGDKSSYPSRVGHMPGQEMDDFVLPGHRHFAESVRILAEKKINPVKVLTDGAHDLGMKVHVGIRPGGWSYPDPFSDLWETPFYKQNPQWRCIDRNGDMITRMSWAAPEVRKHLIDLLAEMVSFGADGAHLVFHRAYPLVLYEPQFCEMFQKKYRLDPRKINDDDPRLIGLRADIVTGFFKELRAALDQEQQRRGDGKHIEISAAVLVNEINNLQYGVDLRRLINEGLMDELFIISGFGATRGGDLDLDFFREICRPKGTRFSPWVTNSVPLRQQIKTALAYYEAGAYGAYDSGDLRFGHVEELKWRLEQLEKLNTDRMPVKYYYFHRLGDNIRDTRYGCWWGG